MSRVLVTGSTDGIGARIADLLARQGHEVLRHARTAERAATLGGDVVIGDLASLASTRLMAESVAPGAIPVWLATSDDPAARVTGAFFHERRLVRLNPVAERIDVQEALVHRCAELTGTALPLREGEP